MFSLLGYFTTDGYFIEFFANVIRGFAGYGYYAAPFTLFLAAWTLGLHYGRPVRLRTFCVLMIPLFLGALVQLISGREVYDGFGNTIWNLWRGAVPTLETEALSINGGVIGGLVAIGCRAMFGKAGSAILFITLLMIFIFAGLNITPSLIAMWWRGRVRVAYEERPLPESVAITSPVLRNPAKAKQKNTVAVDLPLPGKVASTKSADISSTVTDTQVFDFGKLDKSNPSDDKPPFPVTEQTPVAQIFDELPPLEPVDTGKKLSEREIAEAGFEVAESIQQNIDSAGESVYRYPQTNLLLPASVIYDDGRDEVAANTRRLDQALRSFGVDAEIVNVTRGPSVTRYELELAQGVKLNKLTTRADDIALSLGASGVRIAPIINKISTVGVEVPNKQVTTVRLREIIESDEFRKGESVLTFALGRDIAGNAIVGDISKLPHMLIAGTTGSGKSVCMNSLILSLLFKSSPEDVRLIMIDPKMVELGIYNGIPHLLIPVVTDPKKAAGALQWGMYEMMKRYKLFQESGVSSIDGYNDSMKRADNGMTLPRVVILIDELADLMMVAAKDVEDSICRIAAMGRAAGIHLIVATQRPSADVITGTMKSNIPSRIAFAVDSAINSRIILDQMGAEKLVGKGDMLYSPIGIGKPARVQGTFVSDAEREDVIEFIKAQSSSDYSEDIIREIDSRAEGGKHAIGQMEISAAGVSSESVPFAAPSGGSGSGSADEMFDAAVEVMLETGQASVSMLQRRLKLGYGRAARLVDEMENKGIVGPFDGAKPRKLLITREEWENRAD
jgi:S-DNA-T family DNA segregation ATPase FtsK/SpoIIIE